LENSNQKSKATSARRGGNLTSSLQLRPQARRVLASLSGLLLFSCASESRSDETAATRTDSAGVEIVHNHVTNSSDTCSASDTPVLQVGVAEGSEEYELHRVFGAALLSDRSIVLANQGTQELRFFDSRGIFTRRAGRSGRGPGEFQNAFQLWRLEGDTVYVGDYRPWQFLVFDHEGKWIRTVRPSPVYSNPPKVAIVMNDGRLVMAPRSASTAGTEFALEHLVLLLHHSDGVLLDTLTVLADGQRGRIGTTPNAPATYPLFESFAHIAGNGHQIAIGHGSRPEIRIFTLRDRLRLDRIVRWTSEGRDISATDVTAERVRIAEPFKEMPEPMRSQLLDPLVSDRRPIARLFPALDQVKLGREGSLWFREYPRPTVPAGQRWTRFGANGRFICRVTLTTRGDVLDIGPDFVLMHERTADGVEQVRLFTLSQP
jgi:hypothetical protein